MIEIAQLLVFLIIFYFLYRSVQSNKNHNDEVVNMFSETVEKVLKSQQDTNDKFFTAVKDMQIKHFNDLEKHSAKQLTLIEKQAKLFIEGNRPIVQEVKVAVPEAIKNEIEKEDKPGTALEDLAEIDMSNLKGVQFEGQEEIFPLEIS